MAEKLSAVKGMNDIAPPDSAVWEWLEERLRGLMARYGFRNVRTPIVEPTALFIRGIGEVTDIVEKEMYSFEDRLNGEALTLRPEATAGVVRAAIEHNWLYEGPKRLYYMGPMFRHERPQRGRYRQFHQFGVEALGFASADVDAEVILMAADLWAELGLREVSLEINCLGQPNERAAHREALIAYLLAHEHVLDEEAKRRLHSNPLRILDTKNPAMQAVVEAAPKLIDFLGEASLNHLRKLESILTANDVAYRINPRLVRGLDYYNLTVFEFVTTQLGSQGTICAGGRYDGLMGQIGGKPAPAVGWALGIERLIELLREQALLPQAPVPDMYAVVPEGADAATVAQACRSLRQAGCKVWMHGATEQGQGSMKSQFKRADGSGASYALIFGPDELARGVVSVKPLRASDSASPAAQLEVELSALEPWWQQRMQALQSNVSSLSNNDLTHGIASS